MKKFLLFTSFFLFNTLSSFQWKGSGGEVLAQTPDTIMFSDGALISIYSDSVIIDGNFIHQGNDTIENYGNVYLTGDWINNNPSNKIFTNGTDGWLHLSGASQTISGTTPTHFNNLELSGTGVKQLNSIDAEVEDTLALNDREFLAGDNTVFVLNNNPGVITRMNTMTGGFVSSTNNGGLSRQTLSNTAYSFPVGSSSGTLRYRPVDLIPNASSANTFKVRMANVNPTVENYDVSLKDSSICIVNLNFYHRIFHSSGTDAADVKIYFDAAADGNFQTIAHWQNIPQWENTLNNTANSGSPLSSLTKSAWNNFSNNPFALAAIAPAPPTVIASGPTTICQGGSVTLMASPADSFLWSNGLTTQNITVTDSGSYSVTVTNNGCSASSAVVQVMVNNFIPPSISSSGSSAFCQGDTLDAGAGYSGYIWSNSQITQTVVVDSGGTYAVTVTSSNGCTGTASVTINNSVPVILAIGSTTFCEGGNVTLDAGNGFSTYLWSNGETTQTVNVGSGGNYFVTVTDSSGCSGISQTAATVTVNPAPNVTASPDDTINLGQSDTLLAIGALSYQWEPGNGSGTTFIVSPKEETTYTVIGTDSNGCVDTAMVKIYVDVKCVYWLPNIFSPNGDAQNDELKIYGRGLEWIALTIYDRWGNRVFETSDINAPWDGNYNGGLLNTGVYVYILKGKCVSTGEEFEQHGNVTLTR